MKKPLILVTNDDGIAAPGIRALIEVARELGDVLVIAPDKPQSGQGHAITIKLPLRVHPVDIFEGIDAYECSGTPVDCVKFAKYKLLKGRQIDLCVSGINHGGNAAINILYSGTMSAAMEASIEGIDSIGFSLLDYSWEADFSAARVYARRLMEKVLSEGLQECKLLNVNIPRLPLEQIKGALVCRQAACDYSEEFIEGTDPHGQKYYWLGGEFMEDGATEGTDVWALKQGYVSIVPSTHDLTSYRGMETLKHLENLSL